MRTAGVPAGLAESDTLRKKQRAALAGQLVLAYTSISSKQSTVLTAEISAVEKHVLQTHRNIPNWHTAGRVLCKHLRPLS